MKKLLILLVLAATFPLGAATVTTTTAQDTILTWVYTQENAQTCAYYGLPADCTMGQARQQFCKRAGFGGVYDPVTKITSPLTPTCDGSTQVIIWADPTAFLQRTVNNRIKDDFTAKKAADAKAKFAATADAASPAQKDAACVALGLAAGCL